MRAWWLRWYLLRWRVSLAYLATGLVGTLTAGFVRLDRISLRAEMAFLDHGEAPRGADHGRG